MAVVIARIGGGAAVCYGETTVCTERRASSYGGRKRGKPTVAAVTEQMGHFVPIRREIDAKKSY